MNYRKLRPDIMGGAALYLLYIAYDLFRGRTNPETDMSPALRYGFVAFFVLAAAGLLFYAYRLWSALRKESREEQREDAHPDEHDLKS